MKIPPELIPIIGPVVAATIAGAVAFLASVFTKETKTSEFRQAWIEQLRNDLADFVSLYTHITDSHSPDSDDFDQWLQSLKPEFIKLEQMQVRIELRLNPGEHAQLISRLKNLVRSEHLLLSDDDDSRRHELDTLISDSQSLLRKEWKRVKRGEPIYRATKWASLGIVALMVVIVLGVL